jgi:hypothetical protein
MKSRAGGSESIATRAVSGGNADATPKIERVPIYRKAVMKMRDIDVIRDLS